MAIQTNKIYTGDSAEILKALPANSVDSVVTDPPYGISLLGIGWDSDVPGVDIWTELLRVLKPGGHLLAFAGTRTYHRMATYIEKAGFEVRDQLVWIHGGGFPASYNIHLGIEKKYGLKKAEKWRGWGTTLKPAHEPIVMARKPFSGTVTDNVLAFRTGGINIDDCRIPATTKRKDSAVVSINTASPSGRFPANVTHDGVDEPWASYFYCSKPSAAERSRGLENQPARLQKGSEYHAVTKSPKKNFHPTVKPIDLMQYLITLVTPPEGIVLDPFAGSGSTLIAAQNLGNPYIGIEMDSQYVELAEARLAA